MQEKILKLCKRLKSCTLNDLISFLDVDVSIIETALLYLEQAGFININNEIITVNLDPKPKTAIDRKNIYLMKEHISDEQLDIIIKSFCLEIPPQKSSIIANVSDDRVCNYYCIFRKLIYERQFNELISTFIKYPQIGRYRKFYEKYAYFYTYQSKVFVSDKFLRGNFERDYTKPEIREFKNMYCYLSRVESHNVNKNYMYFRLAEYIWRRNKKYVELYTDIYKLIA